MDVSAGGAMLHSEATEAAKAVVAKMEKINLEWNLMKMQRQVL